MTGCISGRAGVSPRLVAAIAALLAGGCRADQGRVPAFSLGEPIDVQWISTIDSLPVFGAAGLAGNGTAVHVLDAGNHRVVRLDERFRPADTYGAPGAGPGELGFAAHMVVRGDTVAVGDVRHGRVVLFASPNGQWLRNIPVAGPPGSFAWLSDGAVLTPARSGRHYLHRADVQGNATNFAERPAMLPSRSSYPETLVSSCSAAVHVFDDDAAVMLRYSLDGSLIDAFSLPDPLRRRLLKDRDAILLRFRKRGYNVVSLPLLKQFTSIDCDRVLVLFVDSQAFAAVVNYDRLTVQLLRTPPNARDAGVLQSASAALVHRDVLLVLGDDEVHTYAIR